MKRSAFVLSVALAVAIAVRVPGTHILNAQQEPMKRTVLLRTDLAEIEGKGALVIDVEHAPGVAPGKHYHPWHEFVYVLNGSLRMEVQGKPPVT